LRLVLVLILTLLIPRVAAADTDVHVRDHARALELSPPMLYPVSLPSRLVDTDVTLSTDNGISISWDRGRVSPSDNNRVGGISLTRGPRTQLAVDLRTARSRGYRPRRVGLRGRPIWRLCGHVCGYAWIEGGRYYGVYGIYDVGDGNGQTVARDQRLLIRNLRPLE
jgi:hypothetical protein